MWMNAHERTPRRGALLALAASVVAAACATPTVAVPEDDAVIGRPPSPQDDPFAVEDSPPPAARVEARGIIGDESLATPPDDARPAQLATPKPEPPPGVTTLQDEPSTQPLGASSRPASPAQPATSSAARAGQPQAFGPDPSMPPEPPPRALTSASPTAQTDASSAPQAQPPAQCFSCVRVCDASDPSEDCSQSPEDMICGWGAAARQVEARQMARAQCDAMLDMARQLPRWRQIQGSCPTASCRP